MAERKWTPEQRQAIDARGGTLLVSAAAGSGKTSVLVERILSRMTDKDAPVDADRLLVVTFTTAAAAEMRERLTRRLSELAAADPEDPCLRRQQLLLPGAHISTIDAFCLDLLRENFQKLDLPPDFRVADEKESKILRGDLLDEILEERYARAVFEKEKGGEPAFLALSELLGRGRGDGKLADTVLRLYDFMRALPDPRGWFEEKLRLYEPDARPLAETPWGKTALAAAREKLLRARAAIRAARTEIDAEPAMQKAYGGPFGEAEAALSVLCARADAGDWDGLCAGAREFAFPRLGPLRNFDDARKERAKAARDKTCKTLKTLRETLLSATEAETREDLARLRPLVACLFDTARELDEKLTEKKRADGTLDFGDLEQLALRLLLRRGPDGSLSPTPEADAAARQFDEILVDEYQDVNRAQDAIFRAVSRGGENLFLVGDVKQSVYRFRQAMPELFMEKLERFADYGNGTPARLFLSSNFRSREGVTSAVNFVFSRLMSKECGEIDYGEKEKLVAAARYPEREDADFELHLVVPSEDGEDAELQEAAHIASVIRSMVESGAEVAGDGGPRPCTYRDFCVLLRAASGHAAAYMRGLAAHGVPVWADVSGGYLGSSEVAVLLSLLRVLDNPLQDIPLLSVMLSPVFGFTPDELAALRGKNRKERLYASLLRAAKENAHAAEFVETLSSLRRCAAVLPADRLILKIYDQTGYLDLASAMPNGEKRRANLRLLLDYARGYEGAGYKGLSGFIRFIDRLHENGDDLAPASVVSESADVVRIMSIHKSKGLEFPFVFVANCEKQLNLQDLNAPALFHPEFGFGSCLRDRELGCRHTTLPREVVRLEMRRSTLSEELRVLYVAMTRARERLFMTMALRKPDAALNRAASFCNPATGKLDPAAEDKCSVADWLLACALRHPSCAALRARAGVPGGIPPAEDAAPWKVVFVSPPAAGEEAESRKEEAAEPDVAVVREIEKRAAFRYPHEAAARTESKLAVSELAEAHEEFGASLARPSFLSAEALTAAEAGTALHAFLQFARPASLVSAEGIEEELQRLVRKELLLPEQAAAVVRERVLRYARSELFARIRAAERVWREFRFTVAVPAAGAEGENTVLQGMADLVFEENGRLFVADYKTDRVKDGEELCRRYRSQVEIYMAAAGQIMERPVAGGILYSFHLGRPVEIGGEAGAENGG